MKVIVHNVRLSFFNGFKAVAFQGDGKAKFSTGAIIRPSAVDSVAALREALEEVAKEKWGAKDAQTLNELIRKDRVCFQEKPKCNAQGDPYEGYKDMFSLSASADARPLILDRNKAPLNESDGRPYSGCYADIGIEIWAQDNQYGKRINATLKAIRFRADGDAFSGGVPASPADFEDLAVEDDIYG